MSDQIKNYELSIENKEQTERLSHIRNLRGAEHQESTWSATELNDEVRDIINETSIINVFVDTFQNRVSEICQETAQELKNLS